MTTVALTEFIKWQVKELNLEFYPFSGTTALIIAFFCYYYLAEWLVDKYCSGDLNFRDRRKKKVIISLIDIEIEKRKKHQ